MATRQTNTQRIAALEGAVAELDDRIDGVEASIAPHNQTVTFVVTQFLEYDGNPDVEGTEKYAPADFQAVAFAATNGAQPSDYEPVVSDRFDCPLIAAEALVAAGIGYILEAVDG